MSSEIMPWLCLDNYLRMEFLIWFYSKMCLYRASRGSYDKSHFLNKLADNMLIYLEFGERRGPQYIAAVLGIEGHGVSI